GHGRPQKFEHYGHGGGGGHAQGVEKVQQKDVGDHHRHKDEHDLVEIEFPGIEDPLSGNLHQATGKNSPTGDPYTGHDQDGPEGKCLGAQGGIHKVHRIVAHSHNQIREGQDSERHQHQEVYIVHRLSFKKIFQIS